MWEINVKDNYYVDKSAALFEDDKVVDHWEQAVEYVLFYRYSHAVCV